jgi:hypothetical protein
MYQTFQAGFIFILWKKMHDMRRFCIEITVERFFYIVSAYKNQSGKVAFF